VVPAATIGSSHKLTSNDAVRAEVEATLDLNLEGYETAPADGFYKLLLEKGKPRPSVAPKYLALRSTDVIPQSIQAAALEAWPHLEGITDIPSKENDSRSDVEARHIGTWGKPSRLRIRPWLAAATIALLKNPETREPTKACMAAVRDISAAVEGLVTTLDPKTADRCRKITYCARTFPDRSQVPEECKDFDLSLGNLFSSIAFKLGGSGRSHLDHGDRPFFWTIISTLGDFRGGEFICDQLKLRIPLPSGSCLMVAARDLIHRSGHVIHGSRYVITGFIDRTPAKQADVDRPGFAELSMEQYHDWAEALLQEHIAGFEARKAEKAGKRRTGDDGDEDDGDEYDGDEDDNHADDGGEDDEDG